MKASQNLPESKSPFDGFVFSTVSSLLAVRVPQKAELFRQTFHRPTTGTVEEQICEMNRYWRPELGSLDSVEGHQASISARECLRDDMGFEDWCRHFAASVLPVIEKYW